MSSSSLYTTLNELEIFLGLFILLFLFLSKNLKWKKLNISLSAIPLFIVLYYITYLAPSLIEMGHQLLSERTSVDELGHSYYQLKAQHAFYHKQYIIFDGVKLVILFLMIVLIPFSWIESEADKSPT